MMKIIMTCSALFLSGSTLLAALSDGIEGYDYPIDDSFVATVVGTPSEFKPELPSKIRSKTYEIEVFKNREIPSPFWHQKKLRFSLAYQREPAPLIFVIAGTGASFRSAKMLFLEKVFFQQGYHVISISSPTHPDFVVSASTTSLPGNVMEDAQDLYRVMQLALEKVKKKIVVTDYYLTGYSLGATQSAFISLVDETKKSFNFKKVILLNPSVNLINSVQTIDGMLENNIPGGLDHFNEFHDRLMSKISAIYAEKGKIDFSEDFLYQLYEEKKEKVDDNNVEALIGLSFRISSSSMLFCADVMSKGGLIVPINYPLTKFTKTGDFAKVCGQTNFTDYFDELFFPYFKARDPSLTKEKMVFNASLRGIEDYLAKTSKIGVMTNENDFILKPDEVQFLKDTFKDRAVVYPNGGHCGNMECRAYVSHMLNFLK